MRSPLISVSDALSRVLDLVTPLESEEVSLLDAEGRVLAHDLVATHNQPPFPSSAMDGYAVRNDEVETGARFKVIGEAAAGHPFSGEVNAGEAVRTFTGGVVPDGADRIVIQEDTVREGDIITLSGNLDPAKYVRPAGLDFAKGDIFARRRLTPQDISLLAAMNFARLPVIRRPKIAILPTGDELVEPGNELGAGQIVSSNGYGLATLLRKYGAAPILLPIAADTEESLRHSLKLAKGADMLVTMGGASVGDHDLVASVFGDAGLTLDFHKIRMRPGKPLMAGSIGKMAMVGLPGNPVSSMVCAHLFLRPAIDAFAGLPASELPREKLPLACAIPQNGGREHYMRATIEQTQSGLQIRPFSNQDSSVLSNLSRANCLVVIQPDAPAQPAGSDVEIIRL